MSQFRGTVRSAEDEEFSPLRPGSPSAAQIFEFNNFAGGRPPNPSESLRARSISRDTKRRAMAKEGTEGDEEMEPSEAARQSHSAEPPGHGVITGYDNRSGAFDKFVGSSRNFENGGVANPALLTTVQINNGVANPALADDEDDGWKHAILMEIDEEPNQHSQGTRTDQEQFDPRTRTEYAQQEQHMGHPGSEQQQAEWWYLHGQEASRLEQSAANFRTEQPDRYGFGQPRMHQSDHGTMPGSQEMDVHETGIDRQDESTRTTPRNRGVDAQGFTIGNPHGDFSPDARLDFELKYGARPPRNPTSQVGQPSDDSTFHSFEAGSPDKETVKLRLEDATKEISDHKCRWNQMQAAIQSKEQEQVLKDNELVTRTKNTTEAQFLQMKMEYTRQMEIVRQGAEEQTRYYEAERQHMIEQYENQRNLQAIKDQEAIEQRRTNDELSNIVQVLSSQHEGDGAHQQAIQQQIALQQQTMEEQRQRAAMMEAQYEQRQLEATAQLMAQNTKHAELAQMQIEKDNRFQELQTMLEMQQREILERDVEKKRAMEAISDQNTEKDIKYRELLTIKDQAEAHSRAIEDKSRKDLDFCKSSNSLLFTSIAD